MNKHIKNIFATATMLIAVAFIMCSCAMSTAVKTESNQPETVIVKETVFVTETKNVTESNNADNAEETEPAATEDTTSEDNDNKGYTTQEILKKAANTSEKQYWILYYCDNNLRMQSFNALEGFTVTLRSDQHLKCDRLVGDAILYYWDESKSDFSISNSNSYGDWSCNDIIGGNVDVLDEKNGKTISARTE